MEKKFWKIKVFGTVQGVGFRPFIYKLAKNLDINGWVKNKGSYVEMVIFCRKNKLQEFLERIQKEKPNVAKIDKINVEKKCEGNLEEMKDFFIKDSEDSDINAASFIPPDLAICKECLKEVFDEENERRYLYPFTICTNCGPRFSILIKLPYDRKNTSMKYFKMCSECLKEYKNVLDRRYHAEPNSCKKCGPRYILLDKNMKIISEEWPKIVKIVSKKIKEGKIVAIKGIGGFHLCCDAKREESVKRLRILLKRPQKPFAVMLKDLETAKKYCLMGEKEERVLGSNARPILILEKKKNCLIPDIVSPKMNTLGIMLPYAPIHYILFEFLKKIDALIMTSANISGFPMAKSREELKSQGKIFDYVLDHNREVVNRIDDSVTKKVDKKIAMIRRSRGYVPSPIDTREFLENHTFLAMGGDMMNSFSIYKKGKIYQSQYIGDLENARNVEFLEKMLEKYLKMLKVSPDILIVDKNPAYISKEIGLKTAKKFGCRVFEVQHHFAHMHSLMCEAKKEEIVAVCVDGTGYGEDSRIWGGEIIYNKYCKEKREFHVKYFPMPGCEKAIYEIDRIAFGILSTIDKELAKKVVDKEKANVFEKMIENSINVCWTSSLGRFLDACSFILGVCKKRSYEGEAAMKLEAFASKGKKDLFFDDFIKIKNNEIDLRDLFLRVFESKDDKEKEKMNVAYSLLMALGRKMGRASLQVCKQKNISCVGVCGGVAYNNFFVRGLRETVEKNDVEFVANEKIPRGDNGLCVGQIDYVLKKMVNENGKR